MLSFKDSHLLSILILLLYLPYEPWTQYGFTAPKHWPEHDQRKLHHCADWYPNSLMLSDFSSTLTAFSILHATPYLFLFISHISLVIIQTSLFSSQALPMPLILRDDLVSYFSYLKKKKKKTIRYELPSAPCFFFSLFGPPLFLNTANLLFHSSLSQQFGWVWVALLHFS